MEWPDFSPAHTHAHPIKHHGVFAQSLPYTDAPGPISKSVWRVRATCVLRWLITRCARGCMMCGLVYIRHSTRLDQVNCVCVCVCLSPFVCARGRTTCNGSTQSSLGLGLLNNTRFFAVIVVRVWRAFAWWKREGGICLMWACRSIISINHTDTRYWWVASMWADLG